MPDRPILFSGPMVRALLDGRKTQTRRLLKPQPQDTDAAGKRIDHVGDYCTGAAQHGQAYYWRENGCWNSSERFYLPYAPGDRLWVKEALERANGEAVGHPADRTWLPNTPWVWRRARLSGRFCPRRLSRLTLTVTDVRVERLQDISEADAVAEGVERDTDGWRDYQMSATQCCGTALDSFRSLWSSINTAPGKHWEDNPWVAAISFTVERRNIDGVAR